MYISRTHTLSCTCTYHIHNEASPMAQRVKNQPAIQETKKTQVQSLGWKIPWRGKWQPTPVFLPGTSHGQSSLVGYSHEVPESGMTEPLTLFMLNFPILVFDMYMMLGNEYIYPYIYSLNMRVHLSICCVFLFIIFKYINELLLFCTH